MIRLQATADRRLWLLLFLAVLLASAGSRRGLLLQPPTAARSPRPAELLSGAPLEQELAGGRTHRYPLRLAPDRYLRIEVEQRGIDVVLRLLSPGGSLVVEADAWTGAWGPDRLAFLTDGGGIFVLEVVPASRGATPARYTVRIVEHADATSRNRLRSEGEAALAQGRLLFLSGEGPKYERAAKLFREALGKFEAAADRAGQADAHYALAMTHLNLNRGEEARRAFARGLPIARSLRDRRREGDVLVMRAVMHMNAGRANEALDDASRALLLWRTVPGGAGEVCRALNVLTSIYAQLGDRANTRLYSELAVREGRAFGQAYVLHEALRFQAGAELWLDDPEAAIEPVVEALALSDHFGAHQKPTKPLLLSTLGSAQRMLGRHEEARETLSKAVDLSRALGLPTWEASAVVQLADTYREPSERARRRELAAKALRLAREVGLDEIEASSLAMLARLELESGDLREARRLAEDALRIYEERWRLVPTPDLRATYLARNFGGHQLYAEILVRSWQRGLEPRGAALALAAMERARARSLQAQVLRAREEVRGEVPPELLARRQSLGEALLAETSSGPAAVTVAAMAGREMLAGQLRDVERRIRELSPRYADLMLPEPIAVEELQQRLLDDETVLLEYALGAERSYAWAVWSSGLRVAELPPRETIETTARSLVDAVTARGATVRFETPAERQARIREADASVQALAAALAKMVLEPVAPAIAGKRLAIVADGALQYVPWGALPAPVGAAHGAAASTDEGSGARVLPLAAFHEIVHLPSAAALGAIRRAREESPSVRGTLAVVADPVLDDRPRLYARRARPGRPMEMALQVSSAGVGRRGAARPAVWPALPFARAEAEAILALAPPRERLGAFGFDADRELVRTGALAGYRIVHFATHALMEGERPERSGIVLSTRDEEGRPKMGLLSLHDLYQLRLGADLVVLSGCRTGLGQDVRGEGLVGLTHGFMFAGAPRVVVSLWDVHDRATAVLMQRFYELLLREGRSPAAALRGAQLSLASSEEWREPYYWAGFVLQGDWRQLPLESGPVRRRALSPDDSRAEAGR